MIKILLLGFFWMIYILMGAFLIYAVVFFYISADKAYDSIIKNLEKQKIKLVDELYGKEKGGNYNLGERLIAGMKEIVEKKRKSSKSLLKNKIAVCPLCNKECKTLASVIKIATGSGSECSKDEFVVSSCCNARIDFKG